MRKNSTLFSTALFASLVSCAAAQAPNSIPDTRQLDALIAEQRTRAEAAMQKMPTDYPRRQAPKVDMQRIKELGSADPLEIANRYRSEHDLAPKEALYIFVSTSMPPKTLKLLAAQAQRTSATLVVRGIKGGIPGYTKMVEELKPVLETGVAFQIHPELFDRFQVTAVPAFVLAKTEEGCVGSQCDGEAIAASGDVSLGFALDHLATYSSPLAAVAARLRKQLP